MLTVHAINNRYTDELAITCRHHVYTPRLHIKCHQDLLLQNANAPQ